jgi:hypothetical protein
MEQRGPGCQWQGQGQGLPDVFKDIKDQLREAAATADENTAIGKYTALEEHCRLTPSIADIAAQSEAAVTATKAAFESNVAQLKLA